MLQKEDIRKKWLTKLSTSGVSDNFMLELLEKALDAYNKAYAPYSSFKVGSAVLTDDNQIFEGCNIENSSFGATVCAERVAIFKAIYAGYRSIKALSVIADQNIPIAPCGICRQVLAEFSKDAIVLMSNINGDLKITNIKLLLPEMFEYTPNEKK